MPDAATGNRAILGRSIEKINLGIPLASFYDFLRFDKYELSRLAKENPSLAITGSEGEDKGTPGIITFKKAYVYDMTSPRLLFDLVAMHGKPVSVTVLTAAAAWLVKIRPRRQGTGAGENEPRAATLYVNEGQGTSYASNLQFGRRCEDIELADKADERVKVTANYSIPLGDTIAAFHVGKTGNTGTYAGKLLSRGRRPYDADYTAGKSVFLKVTAISGSQITMAAQVATAGDGLGGGFPVAAYGTATFVVKPVDATTGHDGFTTVLLGASATPTPLGLFGENNEPFQVTLGNATTGIAVGDEFEVPISLGVLATTSIAESRFSTFHLTSLVDLDGFSNKFNNGTMKLMRPYDAYYVNGQRLPQRTDPTGKSSATMSFEKRLFDRRFRQYNDAASRFSVHNTYKIGSVIAGTTADHETVEFWMPQCRADGVDGGDVAGPNALNEKIALVAEQPGTGAPSPPTGFDGGYSWEANLVVPVDPTPLN